MKNDRLRDEANDCGEARGPSLYSGVVRLPSPSHATAFDLRLAPKPILPIPPQHFDHQ